MIGMVLQRQRSLGSILPVLHTLITFRIWVLVNRPRKWKSFAPVSYGFPTHKSRNHHKSILDAKLLDHFRPRPHDTTPLHDQIAFEPSAAERRVSAVCILGYTSWRSPWSPKFRHKTVQARQQCSSSLCTVIFWRVRTVLTKQSCVVLHAFAKPLALALPLSPTLTCCCS